MFNESIEIDAKILAKYFRYYITTDSLVGDIPIRRELHSGGAVYKSGEKQLEVPLTMMSSTMVFTFADTYDFNLEKICTDIYENAEHFLDQVKKSMFEHVTQVTDFIGNVVNGKGKGITHEMILEMLEKIHIEFDQEGKPVLPTMVVHPDMIKNFERLKAEESNYKTKLDEIMSRKREEYYAKKGSRRLSRID